MTTTANIIIIQKSGKGIQQSVHVTEENLYKIAAFKTNDHFEKQQIWRNLVVKKVRYDKLVVFGSTEGNAGQENKYDFPPPIDNTLFFGNILIVRYDKENKPMDLTMADWKSIYSSLFGGFESLGDEDSSEEEEEEEIDKSKLDKYGYEKDGFVVEDCEDEDEDEDADDEDDDDDDDDDDGEDEDEDDEDDDDDEDEDEEEEEESELEVSADSEIKEEEYFTKIE
jgi:hypothetical protein